MTVFNRYVGEGSERGGRLPIEEHRNLIPNEIYDLEQAAVPGQRKKVVDRLIRDLAADAV